MAKKCILATNVQLSKIVIRSGIYELTMQFKIKHSQCTCGSNAFRPHRKKDKARVMWSGYNNQWCHTSLTNNPPTILWQFSKVIIGDFPGFALPVGISFIVKDCPKFSCSLHFDKYIYIFKNISEWIKMD